MKFILFILIIISETGVVFSQELTKDDLDNMKDNLDNIYNKLIDSQNTTGQIKSENRIQEETTYEKCGFGLISTIKTNIDKFTPLQQLNIKKILQRPSLQKSIISPKGYYRIHYDTAGFNAPAYSITELSKAADSAYNFEVNILGYPPAPADNGDGGDDRYDIYVRNVGNEYGQTNPENQIGDNKYTSFMEMDNDFSGFYTEGINAARVTVAHEYFHAIQIGNYIFREDDLFFYEISSTAMEEFVFDSINDYYAYLPAYFNNSQNSFACFDCEAGNQPYALAIWNIFMKDNFGFEIIKREWELLPQMRALDAISNSILERGSSLKAKFCIFGSWLYFTGYRAVSGKYFEEARSYPVLKPMNKYSIPAGINGNALPMSENYIHLSNNSDSLDIIISNSDYRTGIDSLTKLFAYQISISAEQASAADKYLTNLVTSNPSIWGETDILNNEIVKQDTIASPVQGNNLSYAFPNPFHYGKNQSGIYIPVIASSLDHVDVNIYSSAMEQMDSFSSTAFPDRNGNLVVNWNVKKKDGSKLSSGVYIFFTKSGGPNTTTGKIVIFNE